MKPLVDQEARALIRTAIDQTFIVEAAAGTGKTTELVQRIINAVGFGVAKIDRVVSVTFTEKAAGELKLRLRSGLEQARLAAEHETERRANLEYALAHLEEAWVSTIHGFCAELLRERPVEASVDPSFETLSESESRLLYEQAFTLWLQHRLQSPPEGVRRSLRRSPGEEGCTDRLMNAGWNLLKWRDFSACWSRVSFSRETEIDALAQELHRFADITRLPTNPGNYFFRDTAPVRELSERLLAAEQLRPRDYDGLEGDLTELVRNRDLLKPGKCLNTQYSRSVTTGDVEKAHARFIVRLQSFCQTADADLAALLQIELLETTQAYEDLKKRSGKLDFLDLLIRTRDMIRDHDAVRADFQERFTHIFVDEFQDTDPLQAEILLLLAASDRGTCRWRDVTPVPGKLFIVGDPKQSIYRFRRADVGTYLQVKELLSKGGCHCLTLRTSFRAVPSIQEAVNAAFAPLMTGDKSSAQASYVSLFAYREDPLHQPAVVALPVPEPYGKKKVAAGSIEKSLPDAIGAFVDWLLNESNWTVTEAERPTERIRISARHVCLLFKNFQDWRGSDLTRLYVQALEARGIPHLLVGGKSFHVREEVEGLRTALAAVEWPDDELSVFATLKGSFFAIGDNALLLYRQRYRRCHPFRLPKQVVSEEMLPIVEALKVLQSLHKNRNYRPIADTVSSLLQSTRAHAAFALRPSGEQVLANVLHLSERAREYDTSGGISFRGFVEQLQRDADKSDDPEAPILEEGSEGVRLMTVHKAKGLEFPVVILADMTTKPTWSRASRFIDADKGLCAVRISGWSPLELTAHEQEELGREKAEAVRLAYVAMTRARDLLVVPTVGDPWDNNHGTWIGPLIPAVYPEGVSRRKPSAAVGCPKFGDDSVKTRPKGQARGPKNVSPGSYTFAAPSGASSKAATYDVVWWDPQILKLGAVPCFSIRQQELLEEEDPGLLEEDLKTFNDWRKQRAADLERGSEPSLIVRTATELSSLTSFCDVLVPDAQVLELDKEEGRPKGRRFGALVHASIAAVPLQAGSSEIYDAVALQARILGASEDEVPAACRLIEGVMGHDLLRQAREACARGKCRRETPITLRGVGGTLIEGNVDLAFEEDGEWKVIDFKTDQQLKAGLEKYRIQVGLYAMAISLATGQPATPILLSI